MTTSRRRHGLRKDCGKRSGKRIGRRAGKLAAPLSAPLVRILWRDAYVLTEGWAGKNDTSRPGDDECLVWSAGFLIGEDEYYYRLARDTIIDVKGETVGGVLSVPRAFIVRIEVLADKGKPTARRINQVPPS